MTPLRDVRAPIGRAQGRAMSRLLATDASFQDASFQSDRPHIHVLWLATLGFIARASWLVSKSQREFQPQD